MKQATDRLKFNPPLGRMPVLQFVMPGELQVDREYQRELDKTSRALIRKIAQHWNWGLCQPLVVSRRAYGELFVIDGQHRLEAARLRGDIAQLPAVIVEYATSADEAASFVTLNQQRKPLSKLELFRAAVTSGDTESCAIVKAMEEAGLSVAPHYNHVSWKPGMIANIGGLQSGWRRWGPAISYAAMRALALAFKGEQLRFGGTIYPGIVSVCAATMLGDRDFPAQDFERLIALLGGRTQSEWRSAINQARAADDNLNFARASAKVIEDAWAAAPLAAKPARSAPVVRADRGPQTPLGPPIRGTGTLGTDRYDAVHSGKAQFCGQCDRLVSQAHADACQSAFCKVKVRAAA